MKRLVITGGHHTSALPVIDELKKLDSEIEFIWIGHKYSMHGDTNPSAEYKDITSRNITFYDIQAGKFYKIKSPRRLFQILVGFYNSYKLLKELKPDGILSFGGYIAVPVVICGYFLKIPSVTHEQTVVIGYANKAISRFVKKIFVSWEESKKYFPNNKVIYTGMPLRKELFEVKSNVFPIDSSLPTIYITGGKQGSHIISSVVKDVLIDILQKANVIHQCGSSSVFDDFNNLKNYKESLPDNLKSRYHVIDYVTSENIGEAFNKATLIICRAGAHTVYEILVQQKQAILIPIPWVSHNEQYKNARVLERAGLGTIIPEKELKPWVLKTAIDISLQNIQNTSKNDINIDQYMHAAQKIAYETCQALFKK